MGHGLDIAKVVSSDNLEIGTSGEGSAVEVAANATEAVDAYTNGHRVLLGRLRTGCARDDIDPHHKPYLLASASRRVPPPTREGLATWDGLARVPASPG